MLPDPFVYLSVSIQMAHPQRVHRQHCCDSAARLTTPAPPMTAKDNRHSVLLLGATGAVGTQVATTLATMADVGKVTLPGRRPFTAASSDKFEQVLVDVLDPQSYVEVLPGHDVAICTLGVGQPSRTSREDLVRIDKDAVLDFATRCRSAGVRHFQLLGSVGADPESLSFYLRTKGQLEAGLKDLGFDRLSLFQPSMILTPTNRYGFSQALTLAIWPLVSPLMIGSLRKYRGIRVEQLGLAIALNLRGVGQDRGQAHGDPADDDSRGVGGRSDERRSVEVLHWPQIEAVANRGV